MSSLTTRRLSRRFTRLAAVFMVTVALGALLAGSSSVTAQQSATVDDPAYFSATGFRVSTPAFWNFFVTRGGVRTFGYPVSNEFPLLGQRVQLFQRALLIESPSGDVHPADLLDGSYLPYQHVDGLTLPTADAALLAGAPRPGSPTYLQDVTSFVQQSVPDSWNGMAVNFASTYNGTLTCADVSATGDPCDPTRLPWLALGVWGLPTSAPAVDPHNYDFVYQRFQRGVLFYSASTNQTQWILAGDWLKRAMVGGSDLPADLARDAAGSRFLDAFADGRPLGLARPSELPDTSLADAFSSEGGFVSAQAPPVPVMQTATAVSLTATAVGDLATATSVSATQTALAGPGVIGATPTLSATNVQQTATALALNPVGLATAVALTATAGAPLPSELTPSVPAVPPPAVVSTTPVSNAGCLGDEQMYFVPRKPYVATRVQVSVTSQRHHNVQYMALAGALDTGTASERPGYIGWVWTWTVTPPAEGWYQFTFYADGLHPCITSGFNVYTAVGATATPTPTNLPAGNPEPTNTPTPGAPSLSNIQPTNGGCSQTITILGQNFGTPSNGAITPNGGQVFFGGRSATVINWTNTAILIGIPSGAQAGSNQVTVSVPGGGFSLGPNFNLVISGSGGSTGPGTPTPTPPSLSCP